MWLKLKKRKEEEMSKQDKPITINGIEITPQLMSVLEKWTTIPEGGDSIACIYVKSITQIQDYITLTLAEYMGDGYEDKQKKISEILAELIYIKEDIKQFVPTLATTYQ